jgi:threonine aldolase
MLSGIQLMTVKGRFGVMTPEEVEPLIRPKDAYYMPRTKIIEVENTHNRAGGTIWPMEDIIKLKNLAKKHDLYYHLDGARLWNASIETGISVKEYASHFDSISCCLSKGLGAPVGSVIAGTKEFIKEAYKVRKSWGGGMRQVGILAAAGLYALQKNIERLKDDHRRAKFLAERINDIENLEIDMDAVQTNILLFKPLTMTVSQAITKCKENGLLFLQGTVDTIRAITYLDVDDNDLEKAADILEDVFG